MNVVLRWLLGFTVFMSALNNCQALPHPISGNVGGVEVFYNNTIYLISHHRAILPEAYLYCARYGGVLLEIGDRATEEFMREIAARNANRQFWFGAYRSDVADILNSWRILADLFVNCTEEPDFCATNVEGPHLDNALYSATCIADNTCNKTLENLLSSTGFTNFGIGEPSNQSCSLITFDGCDVQTSCNDSTWIMEDCTIEHNFICQKSSCPPADTLPLDPNVIDASSSEYSTYLSPNIYCDASGTAFTVNYCARTTINLGRASTGGNDTDPCVLHTDSQYLTLPRLSSCNPNITNQNDSISYQYKLSASPLFHNDVTQVIQRRRDVQLSLVCKLDNQATVNSDVMARQQSLSFYMEAEHGKFDTQMFAFLDSDFTQSADNGSVVVPDPIYIGVKLFETNPATFVIRLVECFSYDFCFCAGDYSLVYQGCPSDPHVTVIEDRNSSRARFSFSSFMWTDNPYDDQRIQVVCVVAVCDNSFPGSRCREQVSCPSGRKKRDLRPGETMHEVRSEVITIKPPNSCGYENGGCSHKCRDVSIGKTVCSCPDSKILMSDQKTCYSPVHYDDIFKEDVGDDVQEVDFLEDFSSDISALFFIVSGLLCSVTGFLFYQVYSEKQESM